jgi:hypothetical protein
LLYGAKWLTTAILFLFWVSRVWYFLWLVFLLTLHVLALPAAFAHTLAVFPVCVSGNMVRLSSIAALLPNLCLSLCLSIGL